MRKPTRGELTRRFNDLCVEIQMVQDFDLPCANLAELKMEFLAVGEALAAKQHLPRRWAEVNPYRKYV